MKHYKLYIFGIVSVILFSWVYFSNGNDTNGSHYTKRLFLEDLKLHKADYLAMGYLLGKQIDTEFYAQYRMKADQFFFNYLDKEDKDASFFDSTGAIDKTLWKAKNLGVKAIIKYNGENFYRFLLIKNEQIKPQIIILKNSNDTLKLLGGTDVSKAPVLDNLQKIDEFENKPVLYKMDNNLWVYFP